MNALASMATQLASLPTAPVVEAETESKASRMRNQLRDHGPATARELAVVAKVSDTGVVGALLKNDLHRGRVKLRGRHYCWNTDFVEPLAPCGGRARVRDVLDWHEVSDDDFPDADLTVLVRMRNNEEPVWLGYWDGQEWRDTDNQVVDVVRWTEIPKGGDE